MTAKLRRQESIHHNLWSGKLHRVTQRHPLQIATAQAPHMEAVATSLAITK